MPFQVKEIKPVLGMPYGSVRALLTLLIVSVVIIQLVRGQEVEVLWTETLMIALAHYFTSRRFIKLPGDAVDQLAELGHVEREARPLWLPRHSIRAIIIAAFVGVTVYLYRQNELLDAKPLTVLGVVFAYFLGCIVQFRKVHRKWENTKAIVVLLVMIGMTVAFALDKQNLMPQCMRNISLALTLFYFGSR